MAKLAGRFIKVFIDDNTAVTPVARDVSADINSVDIPEEYGELEMTGFGDGAENSQPGMPTAPVEIAGMFNPASPSGLWFVLSAIPGKTGGRTLTVQQGQNAAPTSGDPEFEGEFWLSKLSLSANPKGRVDVKASLRPWDGTAPAWGTVS